MAMLLRRSEGQADTPGTGAGSIRHLSVGWSKSAATMAVLGGDGLPAFSTRPSIAPGGGEDAITWRERTASGIGRASAGLCNDPRTRLPSPCAR